MSWSVLPSHCSSFVWHLGCTSESSEDLDSKAGEVGVLGHQGHCAAQHPCWQAQAGLLLLWDVLQQLKTPALPPFPWALISKLTTLVWLWGLSTCSSMPTYVLEAWGPVCACVGGMHMCVYIWRIWHVSAGLSVQCAYSVQACVSMCMCPWDFLCATCIGCMCV